MSLLGIDILGLGSPYFPVEDARQAIPDGFAIGCFDSTFSADAIPNINAMLSGRNFAALRVHIWWGMTGAPNFSGTHTIVPLNVLEARLPAYEALARKFPHVSFFISHSCEHNEQNATAVQARMDAIARLAPSCAAVNCPWKGAQLPGVLQEGHGNTGSMPDPYEWSLDGVSCFEIDLHQYAAAYAAAKIRFVWDGLCNLQDGTQPKDPTKRNPSFPPDYWTKLVAAAKTGSD